MSEAQQFQPNTIDEALEYLKKEGYGVFVDVENKFVSDIIVTSGGSVKVVGLYLDTNFKMVDTFGIENDKIIALKHKISYNQAHKFLIEDVKNYLPAPNDSLENSKPPFGIMDFLNDSSAYTPKLAELSRWEQDYLAIKLLKFLKKNVKGNDSITSFAQSIEAFLTTINIITANSFYQVLFDNINSWGNDFHSKFHSSLELRAKTWKKLDLINTSKQGKIVFNSYLRSVVNVKFNEQFNSEGED